MTPDQAEHRYLLAQNEVIQNGPISMKGIVKNKMSGMRNDSNWLAIIANIKNTASRNTSPS